jgi:hypothetical protein
LAVRASDRLSDVARVTLHLLRGGDAAGAEVHMGRLAAEAAVWERPGAPDWYAWPDDLRSGLFDAPA